MAFPSVSRLEHKRTVAYTNREPAKLHRGHFAFMRAVVQGMEGQESWRRYLGGEAKPVDTRRIKNTVQWIRAEFAAAARRFNRHGTARLVAIDTSRIGDSAKRPPSLEEFAELHGLDGFSAAEQLEHYRSVHGKATANESRRSRLIAKQLAALHWLESLVATPPLPDDSVHVWLEADMADRLQEAGISTLRDLVERVNGVGHRWWAGVRAVGAIKAGRVTDWLKIHQESLGLEVGFHVTRRRSSLTAEELMQVVPPATAIVPLEKLLIPTVLSGMDGAYRAPVEKCRINARNDRQAVTVWIASKSKAGKRADEIALLPEQREGDPWLTDLLSTFSNTQRAYWKEAERLMLWAIVERQKALSSLNAEDCQSYCDFLANPVPRSIWCGRRGREKWSPQWRPFEGPLSDRAQRQSITILKNLYKFLVDTGYLAVTPWEKIRLPQELGPRMGRKRELTADQWDFVKDRLRQLPFTSVHQRLSLALAFIYHTGIRLSELVMARTDDLRHSGPDGYWELAIAGQGSSKRTVVLPPDIIGQLAGYLESRGFGPQPHSMQKKGIFLLGKAVDVAERAPWSPEARRLTDAREGIAAATLHDQIKAFFNDCATILEQTERTDGRALKAASAYWLRHAYGSREAANGTSLDALQQKLGHASSRTTKRYAT